jgi:hypothetical protein
MEITQSRNSTPQLSLTINAPIDIVWKALRDEEKLLQWHGWDTPGLKEEIENIYFTNIKEDSTDDKKHTLVVNGDDTFTLEAEEGATKLTLVRAGLSGDPEWDAYYGNITEGWISFIEQLRFMLERSPKAPRKTIFTSMTLDKSKVLGQLNLTGEKAGTYFEGRFQGDKISGKVWFSTPNQLGVVVDAWGPVS